MEKKSWVRTAAAVLLLAVCCLWSYSLGWQHGQTASDLAFNHRMADLTRVMFEKVMGSEAASDEEAHANADE